MPRIAPGKAPASGCISAKSSPDCSAAASAWTASTARAAPSPFGSRRGTPEAYRGWRYAERRRAGERNELRRYGVPRTRVLRNAVLRRERAVFHHHALRALRALVGLGLHSDQHAAALERFGVIARVGSRHADGDECLRQLRRGGDAGVGERDADFADDA